LHSHLLQACRVIPLLKLVSCPSLISTFPASLALMADVPATTKSTLVLFQPHASLRFHFSTGIVGGLRMTIANLLVTRCHVIPQARLSKRDLQFHFLQSPYTSCTHSV